MTHETDLLTRIQQEGKKQGFLKALSFIKENFNFGKKEEEFENFIKKAEGDKIWKT